MSSLHLCVNFQSALSSTSQCRFLLVCCFQAPQKCTAVRFYQTVNSFYVWSLCSTLNAAWSFTAANAMLMCMELSTSEASSELCRKEKLDAGPEFCMQYYLIAWTVDGFPHWIQMVQFLCRTDHIGLHFRLYCNFCRVENASKVFWFHLLSI